MRPDYPEAPAWCVSQWFNTDHDLSLEQMRGKVVVLHAFQMLCPGCVSHGLPQAQRIYDYFSSDDVAVMGLHTVFEHHEAMTPVSLAAFIYEYRLTFPIAVDMAGDEDVPVTMARYQMRGTPTLILIDQAGFIRANYFGRPEDLQIGAEISALINAGHAANHAVAVNTGGGKGCSDEGCLI